MSNRRKLRESVCAVDPRRFQISPPRYRSRGAGIPYELHLGKPEAEPKRLPRRMVRRRARRTARASRRANRK